MAEHRFTKIIIFLDTDKHASSFDILTAIDIFPDATILKFENVTVEDAQQIVYDAMFPRGPEGAKFSKIFINGHDFQRANDILAQARKCMFPPFELAIIIDPRGAYTTASAAVARILKLSLEKNFGTLEKKAVVVLAGTGPVGQTAARLLATEKAEVTLTSRSVQKALAVATRINEELGKERVQGLGTQTSGEVGEIIENAEFVLSAGAAGTELLPLSVLKEHGKKCRIVADVNAIAPLGIEGLSSDADGEEILSRVLGIGALVIGRFKNKIEAELIRRAMQEPKGVFDYTVAYEIAKKAIAEKPVKKERHEAEPKKYWLP